MVESKVDEDTEYIILDPKKLEQKAKIRAKLSTHEKRFFTRFLRSNQDDFANSAKDMARIDLEVIESFNLLRKYRMKLNQEKCIFGV